MLAATGMHSAKGMSLLNMCMMGNVLVQQYIAALQLHNHAQAERHNRLHRQVTSAG
jgi:hypothetical protein